MEISGFLLYGDRDRTRTCDRLLRRQMLYPAELRDLRERKCSGICFFLQVSADFCEQ
jgi:hypothetical protein